MTAEINISEGTVHKCNSDYLRIKSRSDDIEKKVYNVFCVPLVTPYAIAGVITFSSDASHISQTWGYYVLATLVIFLIWRYARTFYIRKIERLNILGVITKKEVDEQEAYEKRRYKITPDNDAKALGLRIKNERERLGYSQEEFATLVNIHRISQCLFENGDIKPQVPYFIAIACTGVNLHYLIQPEDKSELIDMFALYCQSKDNRRFGVLSTLGIAFFVLNIIFSVYVFRSY